MSEPRSALITGITGQDGAYLAKFLLGRGYLVHGLARDPRSVGAENLQRFLGATEGRLQLHRGDLAEGASLAERVVRLAPREIYNLGAQSHVGRSFEETTRTLEVNVLGAAHLLEAARRLHDRGRDVRFFQAASSEVFRAEEPAPWSESTPFHPHTPYGSAKACALRLVETYRRAFDMYACSGILFNHESSRRDETFVTRKITRAAARIAYGLQDQLELGNIDVARDWGWAPEYVEAIWLMLQRESAEDFVIATGFAHTLREFLEVAFDHVGLDWHKHVRVVSGLRRPWDAKRVVGDPARIRHRMGWEAKISFEQIVRMMVDADCRLAKREQAAMSIPA